VLEKDLWQVFEAENGRVALAQIAQTPPDVIVLDLMMPEMDGFEFVVELRSRPAWRDIPVVVITAKDLSADERARLSGGVAQVLQKGASNLDALLQEIDRVLPARIALGRGLKSEEQGA
jgi:CheY-like chemotaxis protein